MKPDWVRWRPDGLFLCERCGDKYKMRLPVPIDMLAACARVFLRAHRTCKAPKKLPRPK